MKYIRHGIGEKELTTDLSHYPAYNGVVRSPKNQYL
jgi:hypothetical protein